MRLGIYGGTFNPPHIGHIRAAIAASEKLMLDVLLIVPSGIPPHKELPPGSPTNNDRMEMARLSFSGLRHAEVNDLELKKDGISYTVETVEAILHNRPGAEIFVIMGSDMYLTLETWKDVRRLLSCSTPAVLSRKDREDEKLEKYANRIQSLFNTETIIIDNNVTDISSTELRELLPKREGLSFVEEMTYAYIIRNRLYGAKPDFGWLRTRVFETMRPKRIPHVQGCEAEAVNLAVRWGADTDEAREAAILHDATKHLELDDQLQLCRKYGIMTDNVEKAEAKLLHSKTGAAVAMHVYGVSQAVHDAIYWHTTGRADMTLLEKIIYIADYIEPTREFDGLDELRSLAYSDLDRAIIKGLKMSIDEMRSRGVTPHLRTAEALAWLQAHSPQSKGD